MSVVTSGLVDGGPLATQGLASGSFPPPPAPPSPTSEASGFSVLVFKNHVNSGGDFNLISSTTEQVMNVGGESDFQTYFDFDQLPGSRVRFSIVGLASTDTSGSTTILNVRVGGTRDTADGMVAATLSASSLTTDTNNPNHIIQTGSFFDKPSGMQLVKLTARVTAGNSRYRGAMALMESDQASKGVTFTRGQFANIIFFNGDPERASNPFAQDTVLDFAPIGDTMHAGFAGFVVTPAPGSDLRIRASASMRDVVVGDVVASKIAFTSSVGSPVSFSGTFTPSGGLSVNRYTASGTLGGTTTMAYHSWYFHSENGGGRGLIGWNSYIQAVGGYAQRWSIHPDLLPAGKNLTLHIYGFHSASDASSSMRVGALLGEDSQLGIRFCDFVRTGSTDLAFECTGTFSRPTGSVSLWSYNSLGGTDSKLYGLTYVIEGEVVPPPVPKYKFERGMRWANVSVFPGNDPRDLVHGSSRIYHVNSVEQLLVRPIGAVTVDVNGVIRNRFVDPRRLQVPPSVRHYGVGSVNSFGEPAFPFASGSAG